jgi:hypothetical protein
MASLNDYGPPRPERERDFHLADLIPRVPSAERHCVEARLCEIEEALKMWLRIKIAEIESVRSVVGNYDGIASLGARFEEEAVMAKDDRDILEVLRAELDFIEKGGYGRSPRTPWKAKSPFQDSLTCINYAYPEKVHPCSACHLIDFVPGDRRSEEVPCHFIPLNESGETLDELESEDNQQKLEEVLKTWLRAKINEIETARLEAIEAT